jgi:putative ABC transport system substrate-binding protein
VKYRVGLLGSGPAPTPSKPNSNIEAFRKALEDLGYVVGQNLIIEARFADGKPDRLPGLAAELVAAKMDVILAGSTLPAAALRRATHTIPIVMGSAADPVSAGLVANLARPESNVTGLTLDTPDLVAKRLQLLKEALPGLRRIAAFYPGELRSFPVIRRWLAETEKAVHALALEAEPVDLGLVRERWREVFSAVSARRFDGATVMEHPQYLGHRHALAEAALTYRLPMIFPFREQAEAGGLMAYGADVQDLWRRAATFVDRILKGAEPKDLPVEQPTKFDFVVNLKTAKTLAIAIPHSLVLRADRVID